MFAMQVNDMLLVLLLIFQDSQWEALAFIFLCADYTRTVVTSTNLENFETKIAKIFGDINNWFKVNQLILNYNKTHYLQFNTKNSWDYDLKLNYQGNYIKSSSNTKFLGLISDDSQSWKGHIDQMMSKLNTACF